jgi:phosphoribosylamine--glycine ligase
MNILIVGNGGREHALAWKLKQSPEAGKIWVAPGNAGTAALVNNVPIAVDQFDQLGAFCLRENIELVVVGPEVPLVKGIRDYFESEPTLRLIGIVGPGKIGAQLEGSKDFSKQFMVRQGIPTAKAQTFQASQIQDALKYVEGLTPPIVLKADGLAAGKGVVIAQSETEAKATLHEMLVDQKFGEASARVLIEEFLDGIELSVFILTDGTDYVILPEAKDYKRIGDGDQGPNTGGMGAVSPVIFADQAFMKKVEERVIIPTVSGLRKEGIPYQGFIFIGLMNVKGDPYVIEYNARMGDPETQVVMTRIEGDFLSLLDACAKKSLAGKTLQHSSHHAVTVALVSGGYPGDYKKGFSVHGLERAAGSALVFHAGTKSIGSDVATDGGRVLAVTGRAATLTDARQEAYKAVSEISWEGLYFRKDIGLDLLTLIK